MLAKGTGQKEVSISFMKMSSKTSLCYEVNVQCSLPSNHIENKGITTWVLDITGGVCNSVLPFWHEQMFNLMISIIEFVWDMHILKPEQLLFSSPSPFSSQNMIKEFQNCKKKPKPFPHIFEAKSQRSILMSPLLLLYTGDEYKALSWSRWMVQFKFS